MARPVRVRIAPSPTGEPHVGTAYIALFNRAFARSHGGQFLLRIEDTDRTRSTKESELAILESLRWLGLSWDEGPDAGGPCGPYRQSERTEHYQRAAEELLEKGAAYRCFCTAERLEKMRKEQEATKARPGYDRLCRRLDPAEAHRRVAAGEPCVVRLAVPPEGATEFADGIRGENVRIAHEEIDDQVLLKSDGFPTYHLANVVDDHLMGISHVIRAEEWIPSTPKHVLLYRAFGWEPPVFAHMPLLRNPDRSKISKRKNPTSLTWYRAAGFLPEALLNFLALLGGAAEGDEEVFDVSKLDSGFELSRIKTSAPVFDLKKLEWMNGIYIRGLSSEAFAAAVVDRTRAAAEYLRPVLGAVRERCKRLSEFDRRTASFLDYALDYEPRLLVPNGLDRDAVSKLLQRAKKSLSKLDSPTAASMESAVRQVAEDEKVSADSLFMALRVAVTGETASLPLFESMAMLGRDASTRRIDEALSKLKQIR